MLRPGRRGSNIGVVRPSSSGLVPIVQPAGTVPLGPRGADVPYRLAYPLRVGAYHVTVSHPAWHEAAAYVCGACGSANPRLQRRCASCGLYNVVQRRDVGHAAIPDGHTLGRTEAVVEVKHSTGLPWLDAVLDGGLSDYACWMLAGEPSCGKTTLAFQIAAGWRLRRPMLVSNEVDASEVAAYALRLGVRKDAIVYGNDTPLPTSRHVMARARTHHAGLVVIDSLNGLEPEASDRLKHWAKRARTPVIMISQVNAAGHAAGPKTRQHVATMVATLVARDDVHPDARELRLGKTRHSRFDKLTITLRKQADGSLAPFVPEEKTDAATAPAAAPPARVRGAPARRPDRRGVRPPPRAR